MIIIDSAISFYFSALGDRWGRRVWKLFRLVQNHMRERRREFVAGKRRYTCAVRFNTRNLVIRFQGNSRERTIIGDAAPVQYGRVCSMDAIKRMQNIHDSYRF